MKVVSRIFLILGSLVALLLCATLVAVGVMGIMAINGMGPLTDPAVMDKFFELIGHPEWMGVEEAYETIREYIAAYGFIAGVAAIGYAIPMLLNMIFGFVACGKNAGKGVSIAGIIFSVLSVNPVTLLGQIFALVARGLANRNPKPAPVPSAPTPSQDLGGGNGKPSDRDW